MTREILEIRSVSLSSFITFVIFIITTLILYHSFSVSFQVSRSPILPTVDFSSFAGLFHRFSECLTVLCFSFSSCHSGFILMSHIMHIKSLLISLSLCQLVSVCLSVCVLCGVDTAGSKWCRAGVRSETWYKLTSAKDETCYWGAAWPGHCVSQLSHYHHHHHHHKLYAP